MVSSTVELHQRYGDRLVIIGIDAAEDPEVVRSFADEHDMTYINLIGDMETLWAYRVRGHPFTVLITADGQVFRTHPVYTDKATLEQSALALLGLE